VRIYLNWNCVSDAKNACDEFPLTNELHAPQTQPTGENQC
jgi:hypothetical protein